MYTSRFFLFILLFCTHGPVLAERLKPGFDKAEYREMMLLNTRSTASPDYYTQFPEPERFRMIYQSEAVGLDNLWDLWTDDHGQVAISLRGTTGKPESWLANFYSAMVPACGELHLSETDTFRYELAVSPGAAVHTGWLISLAYLSRDILPKLDSCYRAGTRDFLLVGHSQGGGIDYLLTAYLLRMQRNGTLPNDIRFKTYCSAAPKPGNLPFAYEYESMTRGWAFNVVNAADWVPQTPVSIQTRTDFSPTNPFIHAEEFIKKQKFGQRIVLKHVLKKLDKPSKKARDNFEKYLGRKLAKFLKPYLPEYIPPKNYFNSMDYVRTGTTISLLPDAAYYEKYPDSDTNQFVHHLHQPYLYLLDKLDYPTE